MSCRLMEHSHYLKKCWHISLTGPLETNFGQILLESPTFYWRKSIRKYLLPTVSHFILSSMCLTHLPLVPHICISGSGQHASDNGLSPIRHQAIIWTNAGLLSIGPLGTNFSEILIKIQNFSFTKMHVKRSSAKWQPFCPWGEELSVDISFYSEPSGSTMNGGSRYKKNKTWLILTHQARIPWKPSPRYWFSIWLTYYSRGYTTQPCRAPVLSQYKGCLFRQMNSHNKGKMTILSLKWESLYW